MKSTHRSFLLAAAALALVLPAPRGRTQQLQPTDPLTAIQALTTANDDLLKRQDATLKDLVEMTDTAREVRLFSKRG